MHNSQQEMPLSGHLDALRDVLWRCLLVWAVCAMAAFCLKDMLFGVILAPAQSDFCLWTGLCRLAELTGIASLCPPAITPHFISTELTAQFMTHLQVSLWAGCVLAAPYVIVKLYGFVAPALLQQEKRFSATLIATGCMLFLSGIVLNYFVIFPFSYRFLSSYQVQAEVINQITLSSYISMFLVLSLMMGILFEIPIVAYFLARMGLLSAHTLRDYRRYAIVGIVISAAVITPTGDAFTLALVSFPIYLLYELSVLIVRRQNARSEEEA